MTQAERREEYARDQERLARDLANGKYKGDLRENGKSVTATAHQTTYALMRKLDELDAERLGDAIK